MRDIQRRAQQHWPPRARLELLLTLCAILLLLRWRPCAATDCELAACPVAIRAQIHGTSKPKVLLGLQQAAPSIRVTEHTDHTAAAAT